MSSSGSESRPSGNSTGKSLTCNARSTSCSTPRSSTSPATRRSTLPPNRKTSSENIAKPAESFSVMPIVDQRPSLLPLSPSAKSSLHMSFRTFGTATQSTASSCTRARSGPTCQACEVSAIARAS
jgi:hypothetical protein